MMDEIKKDSCCMVTRRRMGEKRYTKEEMKMEFPWQKKERKLQEDMVVWSTRRREGENLWQGEGGREKERGVKSYNMKYNYIYIL